MLLLFGVAATSFIAQILNTRGLQVCAAAKAAAMGFTQVLYRYSLGALFFDEVITMLQLLGVLLILLGVTLVTVPRGDNTAAIEAPVASSAHKISKRACYRCLADNDNEESNDLSDVHVVVEVGHLGKGKASSKLLAAGNCREELYLLDKQHQHDKPGRGRACLPEPETYNQQLGDVLTAQSIDTSDLQPPLDPAEITPTSTTVPALTPSKPPQFSSCVHVPHATMTGRDETADIGVTEQSQEMQLQQTLFRHPIAHSPADERHLQAGQATGRDPDLEPASDVVLPILPSGNFFASPFSLASCTEVGFWASTMADMATITEAAPACPELCPAGATAAASTAVTLHRSTSLRSRSTSKTLSRRVSDV
jgi:hypothetical protein